MRERAATGRSASGAHAWRPRDATRRVLDRLFALGAAALGCDAAAGAAADRGGPLRDRAALLPARRRRDADAVARGAHAGRRARGALAGCRTRTRGATSRCSVRCASSSRRTPSTTSASRAGRRRSRMRASSLAPGLRARRPELPAGDEIAEGAETPFSGALAHTVLGPIRGVSEVAFLHRPSRTLILTDACFHILEAPRARDRLVYRIDRSLAALRAVAHGAHDPAARSRGGGELRRADVPLGLRAHRRGARRGARARRPGGAVRRVSLLSLIARARAGGARRRRCRPGSCRARSCRCTTRSRSRSTPRRTASSGEVRIARAQRGADADDLPPRQGPRDRARERDAGGRRSRIALRAEPVHESGVLALTAERPLPGRRARARARLPRAATPRSSTPPTRSIVAERAVRDDAVRAARARARASRASTSRRSRRRGT